MWRQAANFAKQGTFLCSGSTLDVA
jgi:hypothetical protein